MKILLFPVVILSFILACEQKPKNQVSEYGNAMINSYQKGKQAGETVNLDTIRKALQAYHAANDKYPHDLDEIKSLIGHEMDFSRYDYNPLNGTVSLKGD